MGRMDWVLTACTRAADYCQLRVFTEWFGSWALNADLTEGEMVDLFLRRNGEILTETRQNSYVAGSGANKVVEAGGRSLLLGLQAGDTLDLWCRYTSTI